MPCAMTKAHLLWFSKKMQNSKFITDVCGTQWVKMKNLLWGKNSDIVEKMHIEPLSNVYRTYTPSHHCLTVILSIWRTRQSDIRPGPTINNITSTLNVPEANILVTCFMTYQMPPTRSVSHREHENIPAGDRWNLAAWHLWIAQQNVKHSLTQH